MTVIIELLTSVSRNYIVALALTVFLVVEVIKMTECVPKTTLPIMAGVVGIIIGGCISVIYEVPLANTCLNGFIAGLLASGSVDFVKAMWHLPEIFN